MSLGKLPLHLFYGEATPDEQALSSFSHRKLKQLSTSWDLWLDRNGMERTGTRFLQPSLTQAALYFLGSLARLGIE
jgi:hypothetical protein